MARHRILAIGLVLAASMPRPDVLARVAGDDQQIALAVDSSAYKSGSKSVLNDLFAAPVVRDLIARGVLGGLGAAYDFNFVGDTQLVVFVNPGVDDSGASRLSVARAELPGTYKGLRVDFIPTPVADRSGNARAAAAQNGKIPDREIQQAQQGLLGISAMPGSRSLIQNRTITSIFIDYADSPLNFASVLSEITRGPWKTWKGRFHLRIMGCLYWSATWIAAVTRRSVIGAQRLIRTVPGGGDRPIPDKTMMAPSFEAYPPPPTCP